MAHIPINHHLRPLYRTLAGLVGLFSLGLGVAGLTRSGGVDPFQQDGLPRVFGLPVNPAFAVVSIVVGAVVLLGTVIGRNVDHRVNLGAGVLYLLAGLAMMTLLRTDANILGFSMVNCIVSFVLGLITLTAGLYGKVGTPEAAHAERTFRSGGQAATSGRG